MAQKQIERRFTLMSELYYGIFALIPAGFIATLVASHGGGNAVLLAMAVVVGGFLYFLTARYIALGKMLEQHNESVAVLAAKYNWQVQSASTVLLPPELDNASLLLVANREDQVFNYLTTERWNYLDLSYAVYQQTKNGEYKAATVYYSVIVTKLSRILPNVFFDSKTQRGRQFKAKFAKDQRHSLEGNFDQYFDTYFAEGYTIDDMSFVTPDVMQALIAASDFDIEIVENKLLMYGPICVDAAQIPHMASKLLDILKSLQVTAKAYRDTRLPGAAAATTVTPQGMFLRRKRNAIWPTIVMIVIYVALRIWLDNKS